MVDKTLNAARALISNMAANSQQFETRSEAPMKVNEVTTTLSNVDQKITELTAFVHKLAINQVTTYGVCSTIGHLSDLCPTLLNSNINKPMLCEDSNLIMVMAGITMLHQITLRASTIKECNKTTNQGSQHILKIKVSHLKR